MRLLIMGPPGAGKGTQAAFLADHLGIPAVSTGEIFRANVERRTELGIQARQFMDRGEYVPDAVTNAMVQHRIAEPDASAGFLLDGYPRTLAQVAELDGMLATGGHMLNAVIALDTDREELVRRLLRRAEADGRSDDTAQVIRRRLEIYAEQTAPLIEVYRDRGLLTEVDGLGEIGEVWGRLRAAVTSAARA